MKLKTKNLEKETLENENKNEFNNFDTNETFLDQTFNFNASLDILLNPASFASNEVETAEKNEMTHIKIIDCNTLDVQNEDEIADEIEDEIENVKKQEESHDNQKNSSEAFELNSNEENEENLTIVLPEQINNIFEKVSQNNHEKSEV